MAALSTSRAVLNARIPLIRNQPLIGLVLFILCVVTAWRLGETIAVGNTRALAMVALVFIGCAAIIATLRDWRTGFFLFFAWMMFEDLPRKYLGNTVYLFFGKDILLAFVYVSFYLAVRRKREKTFRPPFLFFFSLFFWLGLLQIFNQNSPHVLYGVLGFKLYFYYVPLLFIGYALIRTDEDLEKFLMLNAVLTAVIAGLGVVQAIRGHQFLNPTHLAPELRTLGNLSKSSPLSRQEFYLPDSVFVSAGRFAQFLEIAVILVLATAAYLLLYTPRGRKVVYLAGAVVGAAILLSGSRSAIVGGIMNVLVLCGGFLWGAPWRWMQAHRLVRAIRRSFIVTAIGLAALILMFPEAAGSRLAFYTETLNPNSSAYELSYRVWNYPIENLLRVFDNPHWVLGNGIGTGSLGAQYVAKFIGQPVPAWVEEGYGDLILEMGIIAPFLWILWAAALLYYLWKVVHQLRQTRLFPIAFAIFWYAFCLLFLWTYGGLAPYQDYICSAYLWLLVGILFRLPDALANPTALAVSARRFATRGGFQF